MGSISNSVPLGDTVSPAPDANLEELVERTKANVLESMRLILNIISMKSMYVSKAESLAYAGNKLSKHVKLLESVLCFTQQSAQS